MAVATTHTVTLDGATGYVIDVQTDVASGTVSVDVVGRPDVAINEAIARCRSAVLNDDLDWPSSRRVTILLSPADLPKRGPHFDLAIAIGVLAANRAIKPEHLADVVLIGELTLDGRLRAVPGALPMVMAASRRGIRRVIVPEPQAAEAQMVPGTEVYGVRSLRQAIAVLTGAAEIPEAPEVDPLPGQALLRWRGEERLEGLDLADVRGMPDARYALEVAAAGGHHLLLTGPKGAGKTTLAERLPGLLPDLELAESLEVTALHSLAGSLAPGAPIIDRPPFIAPHHSASRASIVGGGTGRVRPGEVSKAHLGILFLDEFPLLSSDIVESLREPLESGDITIARGAEFAVFPARAMVVLAANPCPCGNYSVTHSTNRCTCPRPKRDAYRAKLEGPVADRIDIHRKIMPTRTGSDGRSEPTEQVRRRVMLARSRQSARYLDTHWRLNRDVPGPALTERWPLSPAARLRLDELVYTQGTITQRGAARVHRLAWTVADLRGVEQPGTEELDVALRLRTGEPLLMSSLPRQRPVPLGEAAEPSLALVDGEASA
ncbi:ATP-binding protein [Nocardioides mangrovicus]|uniref:ATP-binding protein n=1 Tax=Nocardioides mangrovicus TaxID=2478913 RepID=A0A3L8P332_9ACTN|nr:YifB family Mg chelatase-like AAA ATPase [Nocardioides mangrovicus]RLV48838.1 ATP-binding protein [Nocardioides mangrovicus]